MLQYNQPNPYCDCGRAYKHRGQRYDLNIAFCTASSSHMPCETHAFTWLPYLAILLDYGLAYKQSRHTSLWLVASQHALRHMLSGPCLALSSLQHLHTYGMSKLVCFGLCVLACMLCPCIYIYVCRSLPSRCSSLARTSGTNPLAFQHITGTP